MDLLRSILRHAGGILVILLLIPFVLLWLFASALFWLILNLAVWILWIPRGKNTLFIYSESPNWHEHVQEHLLPRVQDRAVVLNWTERRKWQRLPTLSNLAFTFFGGRREFNPMAIVFRPFRRPRKFRFYQPYRDFKHGKSEALDKLCEDLFTVLD